MADQAVPTCGIEKKSLRHGDSQKLIRLAKEDITPEALAALRITHEVQPGLYGCGSDAFNVFAPIVAKRLDKPDPQGQQHDWLY
jgi:hypothetical protein